MANDKEVNILGLKCVMNEYGAIKCELSPEDPLYDEFKSLFNGDLPLEQVKHFSARTHSITDYLVLRIDLHIN